MEQRKITCIVCPLGCEVIVNMDNDKIADISGYLCARGESYAIAEVTDPRRILTTTMRLSNGKSPLVSVKSNKPLRKDLLPCCMKEINKTIAKAPVHIGDMVIKNILGSGADIVATGRIERV